MTPQFCLAVVGACSIVYVAGRGYFRHLDKKFSQLYVQEDTTDLPGTDYNKEPAGQMKDYSI